VAASDGWGNAAGGKGYIKRNIERKINNRYTATKANGSATWQNNHRQNQPLLKMAEAHHHAKHQP